jgi:hypothetical protein
MKAAPVARRIFDHQGKTTFATQSGGKADIAILQRHVRYDP